MVQIKMFVKKMVYFLFKLDQKQWYINLNNLILNYIAVNGNM